MLKKFTAYTQILCKYLEIMMKGSSIANIIHRLSLNG